MPKQHDIFIFVRQNNAYESAKTPGALPTLGGGCERVMSAADRSPRAADAIGMWRQVHSHLSHAASA